MQKRVLRIVLALVLAMSMLSFVACGDKNDGGKGGDNDPVTDTFYQGTVSVETYASANAAAEGFLENELSGESTQIEFRSYAKTADLTEEEIAELSIDDETRQACTAVEKGQIEYAAVTPDTQARAVTAIKTKKTTIYIISLDAGYKYFAPALQKGDPVTKSYFAEVTKAENFNNVTCVSEQVTEVKVPYGSLTVTVTFRLKMTMIVAGKYAHVTFSYDREAMGETEPLMDPWEAFFVFEEDFATPGTVTVYLKSGSAWIKNGNVAFDMTSAFKQTFDYTYYEKTGGGFKLNDEKYSLWMKEKLEEINSSSAGGGASIDTSSVKGSCKYFVKDGKLSQNVTELKYKVIIDNTSCDANLVATEKYSKYGETVVPVPEGVVLPDEE